MYAGRDGSVPISDFVDLVTRNSYLPVSLHRTAVEAHADFLPSDSLTLLFGDYNQEAEYFTLRTNDVPAFNISAHTHGRGATVRGWCSLLVQMVQRQLVRPSQEIHKFMGDRLFGMATKNLP
jgi:hypothetical protein